MKVVIFGATGMVGEGALRECLEDPRVESVLVVGRSRVRLTDPKIHEILHTDFLNYAPIQSQLAGCDACLFCLGVSAAGMSEANYHRLTYDVTLAAAQAMVSPNLTFCYVSGRGTDSTERGRAMWARVKGKTENAILRLPFKAAYMFRPAYIQPLKGVRSKTKWYQAVYNVVAPAYPLLRRLLPGYVTTTVNVGRALIQVAANGYSKQVLETDDINLLAAQP
ncbi:MAG TPA: epimerase [Thermoanaerobaculia bacterium]|nr:epimerase [Thermoanaerobaculia bacterium]